MRIASISLVLWTMALLPSLSFAEPIETLPAPSCSIETIEFPPLWLSSALYDQTNSRLLLVDALRNAIIELSPSGRLRSLKKDDSPDFAPSGLALWGSNIFLKMVGSRASLLTPTLETIKPLHLRDDSQTHPLPPLRVGSFYDWSLTTDDHIVGYGAALTADNEIKLGLYRSSLVHTDSVDMLLSLENYHWYTVGFPFVAAMNNTIYFFDAREKPRLVRLDADLSLTSVPLSSILPSLDTMPEFPSVPSKLSSAKQLYDEIEKIPLLPAGIIALADKLYFVSRTRTGDSATWRLLQLDPESLKVNAVFTIPAQSPFITMAAGKSELLVILRGHVHNGSQQTADHYLRIPYSWLVEDSPIEGEEVSQNICTKNDG